MKNCPACGSPGDDRDLFCKRCGAHLPEQPDGSAQDKRAYTEQNTWQTPYPSERDLHPANNGLAVASLVLGIVGIVFISCCIGIVPGILALIFGFVSRNTIALSGGTQTGEGMALAGIILGCITVGIFVVGIILNIALGISIEGALLDLFGRNSSGWQNYSNYGGYNF